MQNGLKKVLKDIFAFIELILIIDIFLKLFSANRAAPLVNLIYSLTDFFTAPVRYIFPLFRFGASTFDSVAVAAMIFYGILFLVLLRLIRLLSGDQLPTHAPRD